MAEPVQRQAVGQLQQVGRASASGQTVNRAVLSDGIDMGRGEQILNIVSSAASTALGYAEGEYQKKIQEDKVKQMNLALLNQAPSDDATRAGSVAHGLVTIQNTVSANTTRLLKEAETFEGDDDAWADYVAKTVSESQASMYEQYGNITDEKSKSQLLEIFTNAYNEQAPRLAAARQAGKIEQERVARLGAFQENLLMSAGELTGAQFTDAINTTINEKREALQLSSAEAEEVLINAAIDAANTGDNRLVEFTKQYKGKGQLSLFERTGKLQNAEKVGKQVFAGQNQGALAIEKSELNEQFLKGAVTFEEFASKADAANRTYGGTAYTDSEIMALRNQRQKAVGKQTDIALLMKQADEASSKGGLPVALDVGDKTTRKDLVAAKQAQIDLVEEHLMRQAGTDDPQVRRQLRNRLNSQFGTWLASNQLVNEDWKNRFDSMLTLNLENIEADAELPDNAKEALELWYSLPEGSKLDHTDPKTQAMMSNYVNFKAQGKTDMQAMQLAQQAARKPKSFTSDQLNKIGKTAKSYADDISDGVSWWPGDSAPDWYAERFSQIFTDMTLANMQAGYVSADDAAKDAKLAFDRYYTRLDNGQMLFGNRSAIAQQMKVNEGDIELTLDTYLERNSQELLDEAGGATLEELYYDVIPNRGTVVIRSGINGMPVTPPLLLSELKVGRDAFLEEKRNKALSEEAAKLDPYVYSAEESAAYLERKELESIDAWTGAARIEGKRPLQREEVPEVNEQFVSAIKQVENSVKSGWNPETKVWIPHASLEGGNDTIAYGHKLTNAEKASGKIKIGDNEYRFTEGNSEITEKVATMLMQQDMAGAEEHLAKKWSGYEDLPPKYQKVLINLQFNTGNVTNDKWPELEAAMKAGDDKKVREEMITKYGEGKDKVRLIDRANTIADAVGLKGKDIRDLAGFRRDIAYLENQISKTTEPARVAELTERLEAVKANYQAFSEIDPETLK